MTDGEEVEKGCSKILTLTVIGPLSTAQTMAFPPS